MWVVLRNRNTGEYGDGNYGWTYDVTKARRYWSTDDTCKSHDHIGFEKIDQQEKENMVNIDEVIAAYIKFRDMKAQIKAEAETRMGALEAKMDKLEAWLKEKADADGVTSFRTKHGTAFLTTVDFASVADWDAMLKFVVENEAFDMFEKRVSKTAVRGYIDQMKRVPPGVNYGTRIEVNVRKPTNKED